MAQLVHTPLVQLPGDSVNDIQHEDDGLALHRYNDQLPPIYRNRLAKERTILIRALRFLANAILTSPEATGTSSIDQSNASGVLAQDDVSACVAEGYERELERDFASLEKGLSRYLDLKHALEAEDYPLFLQTFMRGALTLSIDMGLRSKLARAASRLLCKRDCVLPDGIEWRPILAIIIKVHIDCVDGGPFIGKDIRDAHCRNMVNLLAKCRNFLRHDDSAQAIWSEFASRIDMADVDSAFQHVLLLSHVLPTRGDSWSEWVPDGMRLWSAIETSSDWDAIWMSTIARLARHQPFQHDWTPYLPHIYTRLTSALRLPLGSSAPQGPIERRCPHQCLFLMDSKMIPMAAAFTVYSLSPQHPGAMLYLERLFALIANYFHPSNSGRWSGAIGSFLVHVTANLAARVTDERAATKAGVLDRVFGNNERKAVASSEHRLSKEFVDSLVGLMLPLVQLGLHSKSQMMALQAASASRDLAVMSAELVVEPLLSSAAEGLESVSSPHRTAAALKMLAALTPVFLDPELCANGAGYLPSALQLTLPGIDPNDPGKTESTFRFVAGATARLQCLTAAGADFSLADFLEDYVHELLERVFALLGSLEAPPKKSRNGAYPSSSPQLSYFIFAVAMENLFAAVPPPVAIRAAERVARQITGSASMNAIKYYGALVRTAASSAAVASNGSSVNIFFPILMDQILDNAASSSPTSDLTLSSLSEEELVWRIRMLAQACRACGSGLISYIERISAIICLAMDRPSRPMYKAGGRLLRGLLEGLTAIQVKFGAGAGSTDDSTADGGLFSFEWRIPKPEEWKAAENLLQSFLLRAESLAHGEDVKGPLLVPLNNADAPHAERPITLNRDTLFRVLRMLHAIQRGGRWTFGGVKPKNYQAVERLADNTFPMSKGEAILALRCPVAAGLGGERDDPQAAALATRVWAQTYLLTSRILEAVISGRPDDGALLYRCLEPIELANEPFRRSNQGRQTMHASRAYKAAYKPVIAAKRPFGAIGGVGRAMPRFIAKLRIEAHHEMRLVFAARPGLDAQETFQKMMGQLTDMAINDFPQVRSEARGALTRALRVAPPELRRHEISRLTNTLSSSAVAASSLNSPVGTEAVASGGIIDANGNKNSVDGSQNTGAQRSPGVMYEKMIGAAGVLRSAAASPLIMRDWKLFRSITHALLDAMVTAERPDAAHAVGALFAKLSALARPLCIAPIRLVGADLVTPSEGPHGDGTEEKEKIALYEDLNSYLLSMLSDTSPIASVSGVGPGLEPMDVDEGSETKGKDVHWRLQSLVATILYMTLREDRPPPAPVAKLFIEGMVSDVVSFRQISAKAVVLILSLHGRKPTTTRAGKKGPGLNASAWSAPGNEAVTAIAETVCKSSFARKLIHTLALDHDDGSSDNGMGGSSTQSQLIGNAGGAIAVMNLSRHVDGDACWMVVGGRPWPSSWVPRSRDSLNIVRIRLYEALFRVFGTAAFDAFKSPLEELVEKIEKKEDRIISGVKDDDVRVLAGEVVAGMSRGLSQSAPGVGDEVVSTISKWTLSLLEGMSGPHGMINGGSLIRFISTSTTDTVGVTIKQDILDWILAEQPIIVAMGNGPAAHLQARRLRFLHSCAADLVNSDPVLVNQLIPASMDDLCGSVGFAHELKTVREEVARCLSLIVTSVAKENSGVFASGVSALAERLTPRVDMEGGTSSGTDDRTSADANEESADSPKKVRSREGETLSRLISVVHWNGQARSFGFHLASLLPGLFASLDESDRERISHAHLALSLAAQGMFDCAVISSIVDACESTAESSKWKVRRGVLPFCQVLAFTSLFTASGKDMNRIRQIVLQLLSDAQLEVRQTAAATFVPLIRDAPDEAVSEARKQCLGVVAETTQRRSSGRRLPMTGDEIRRRHGAVLGLSSMVVSSPYHVPEWMPSVLVALSGCMHDPPPISTGARKLFADFMRTHRDEWQTHKAAFTEYELEVVSELLTSPSYYA